MKDNSPQRKNIPDRRVAETAVFPFHDSDGTWVVTNRRCQSRPDDSSSLQTGLINPILLWTGLMLAGFWFLIRSGMIDSPSWLPGLILYPEILIERLF